MARFRDVELPDPQLFSFKPVRSLDFEVAQTGPNVTQLADQTFQETDVVSLAIASSDPNVQNIDISVSNLPSSLSYADTSSGTGYTNGSITGTLATDESGVYACVIRATDRSEPATFTETYFNLTVTEINQAPVLATIVDIEVDEGASSAINISATDADGDVITITAQEFDDPDLNALPSWAILTDNGNGTGQIALQPGLTDSGTYVFRVTVTDDGVGALTDTQDVTVTVNDQPFAPIVAQPLDQTTTDNYVFSLVVNATQSENELMTMTHSGTLPTGVTGSQTTDTAGVAAYTISGTVANLQSASSPFTITVRSTSDTSALFDEKTFDIVVLAETAPVLAAIGNQSVTELSEIVIPISATDANADDTLTITDGGTLPAGAVLTDNGDGTGDITWTPDKDASGSSPYSVTITVTDDSTGTLTDFETFDITVNDVEGFVLRWPPAPDEGVSGGTTAYRIRYVYDATGNSTYEWSGADASLEYDEMTPAQLGATVGGQYEVNIQTDGLTPKLLAAGAAQEGWYDLSLSTVDAAGNDTAGRGNYVTINNAYLRLTAVPAPTGLVAQWPFTADANATTGAVNFTENGTPTYDADTGVTMVPNAYLNGTLSSFNRTTGQASTLGMFVSFAANDAFHYAFSAGNGQDDNNIKIGTDGLLDVRFFDVGFDDQLGVAVTADQVYHVVLLHDPSTAHASGHDLRVYVDGVKTDGQANNGGLALEINNAWVGTFYNDSTPPGSGVTVKDFRIYDEALTDAQITTWSNENLPPPGINPADTDLVAYWPLTADANDAAGTNHFSITGAPTYSAAGISFDGVDDYGNVNIAGALDRTTAEHVTMGCFVTFDEIGTFNYAFSGGATGGNDDINVKIGSDSLLDARMNDAGQDNLLSGVVTVSTEYHVVMVAEDGAAGNDMRWYVDGVEVGTYSSVFNAFVLDDLYIGTLNGDTTPPGAITVRDLRIYHRALTVDEITDWGSDNFTPT